MLRYTVTDLQNDTPQASQEKLVEALEGVNGLKDVTLDISRKEISFGIAGPEPKQKHLQAACQAAGFTLGTRM